MSERLEVSLYIICYEKNLVEGTTCKETMKSLEKIEGMTGFSISNETNVITTSSLNGKSLILHER